MNHDTVINLCLWCWQISAYDESHKTPFKISRYGWRRRRAEDQLSESGPERLYRKSTIQPAQISPSGGISAGLSCPYLDTGSRGWRHYEWAKQWCWLTVRSFRFPTRVSCVPFMFELLRRNCAGLSTKGHAARKRTGSHAIKMWRLFTHCIPVRLRCVRDLSSSVSLVEARSEDGRFKVKEHNL